MLNRNRQIFIEVSPEDVKLISSGLDKLLNLEAKQPRKGRTASEGKALESLLQQTCTKPEPVAMAIWCVNDVMGRAKELSIKCTKEQAVEILNKIDNRQDCELGITWDSIDNYLHELKR